MNAQPPTWQIRLLAGATGAVCSGLAALVTAPTVIGLVFGLVGMPVGAVLGCCYGPELLRTERRDALLRTVASLATVLGKAAIGIGFAITQSRGASLPQVSELAFVATVLLGLVSVPFGYPLARIVARAASAEVRALLPQAWILWVPSAAILWLVAVGTVVVAGSVVRADGFAGVLTGEAVPFRYEVRDSSTEGKGLVALSYADGTMADVAYLPSGACVSSEASVLASDWRRWLTDDHSIDWLNAPTGQLVVSSATLRAESSR